MVTNCLFWRGVPMEAGKRKRLPFTVERKVETIKLINNHESLVKVANKQQQ